MPRIAISMGDPAGIGPEVVVKALKETQSISGSDTTYYIFGDVAVLYEICKVLGIRFELPVVSVDNFRQQAPDVTCVVDFSNVHGRLHFGVECAEYGRASMEYIEEAVFHCMSGTTDALITAPINKKSIHLGGYDFPGHTEFLAALTNTQRYAMSFNTGNIWTILTSTHLPLGEAVNKVKRDHLVAVIQLAYQELQKYGLDTTIAVASLNPHGAEGGLFGMEESMEIRPAVEDCRREGIPVSGPFSADTIYLRALKGEFNVVVTHYHDQGMIPVKLISFGKAVNITLGLPFLRTSVDHGTAFDIAGTGTASAESMLGTLHLTRQLLERRPGLH